MLCIWPLQAPCTLSDAILFTKTSAAPVESEYTSICQLLALFLLLLLPALFKAAAMRFTYTDNFELAKVGWDDSGRIGHIELNRPEKSNAFDATLWLEFPKAVRLLQQRSKVRVLLISAAGKNFCAGLDLGYLSSTFTGKMHQQQACPARLREQFRQDILAMQEAFSVLEQCRFPVLTAVQGACVGAGVDLITAADLRYCSRDAYFSVKEVDLAITADLGTLQRLPAIIGHGAAAELALTARNVPGPEAATLGLVSHCYDSYSDMMTAVTGIAQQLADKSPLAVAGTKQILLHTRDRPGVSSGLEHVALWNSAFLLSADMEELVRAKAVKKKPQYAKL